jgi:hypothetical protein
MRCISIMRVYVMIYDEPVFHTASDFFGIVSLREI